MHYGCDKKIHMILIDTILCGISEAIISNIISIMDVTIPSKGWQFTYLDYGKLYILVN